MDPVLKKRVDAFLLGELVLANFQQSLGSILLSKSVF